MTAAAVYMTGFAYGDAGENSVEDRRRVPYEGIKGESTPER